MLVQTAHRAIVAGAGPAGVAAVGALLHYAPNARILWVDPSHSGGRLSERYRDVSSNTKVSLFGAYAEALKPFQDVLQSTPKPNASTALRELNQDKACRLSYAADIVQMLGTGLRRHANVESVVGELTSADHRDGSWRVDVCAKTNSAPANLDARTLILCTGSSPTTVPLATNTPKQLDLDTALDRRLLAEHLPNDVRTTIGVVGTSHSAIVVLMKLWSVIQTSHPQLRIKWFARSDLLYAVYKDGWILYDNTGLKQDAAEFAREHLEREKLGGSPVGRVLRRVECKDIRSPDMAKELEECDFVVQAVGYTRDALPGLKVEGNSVETVNWEPHTGQLLDENNKQLPKAYGAGIAFPRRVTDPYGNQEWAVGMWKFMRYV